MSSIQKSIDQSSLDKNPSVKTLFEQNTSGNQKNDWYKVSAPNIAFEQECKDSKSISDLNHQCFQRIDDTHINLQDEKGNVLKYVLTKREVNTHYYVCRFYRKFKCKARGILRIDEKNSAKNTFQITCIHNANCPCLTINDSNLKSDVNYEKTKTEIVKYLANHPDSTPKEITDLFKNDKTIFNTLSPLSYEQIDHIIQKFRKANNISNIDCLENYGRTSDDHLFVREFQTFFYFYRKRVKSSKFIIAYSG